MRSAGFRTGMIGAAALVAAAFLPWSSATAQAETPPSAPRPALWLLADADTQIYLFGTVHILPPDLDWRSAAVERAIATADELVLEVDDEDMAGAEGVAIETARLGKRAPVAWRVSPDRRAALAEMFMVSGLPEGSLDEVQTWAVAMSLAVAEIVRANGTEGQPPAGVEEALTEDFRGRGRPISGIETAAQQMRFFSRLPFAVQRDMLEQMIDAYAAGEAFEPGEADWLAGNLDAIAAELTEMPPEMYAALITRRNAAWTRWLIDRLERPGTVLFAVGAGHLVGPDSVQAMLAAAGVAVRRID